MGYRFAPGCLGLLLVTLLVGCGQQASTAPVMVPPTIAPVFDAAPELKPTPVASNTPTDLPQPALASTPTDMPLPALATPVPAATERLTQTVDLQVYDEAMVTGWSLRSSSGVKYNSESKAFAYESKLAVEAIPTKEYGNLIFGVARSAPRNYKRAEVLGVRFRVSGGKAILPNDGLIVTVFGSKKFPYFVAGDSSATFPEGRIVGEEPLFPETRLYFLDINRAIAPGEWAEVIVWLDDHFTPDYTYVTGIQIKNDEQYLDPFYVDDVALIMRQP